MLPSVLIFDHLWALSEVVIHYIGKKDPRFIPGSGAIEGFGHIMPTFAMASLMVQKMRKNSALFTNRDAHKIENAIGHTLGRFPVELCPIHQPRVKSTIEVEAYA
jgi:hypothetical protein